MPTPEQYLVAAFYEARTANLPIKWVEECTRVSDTALDFYISVVATAELYKVVQSHNENRSIYNGNVNKRNN